MSDAHTAYTAMWTEIWTEIRRASIDHPNYPTDPLRRTALVCEEAGEALREALDLTRVPSMPNNRITDCRSRLRAELVQTAAMAVRYIIEMDADRD